MTFKLKAADNQQALNMVYDYLKHQKKRCADDRGCIYIAPDGNRCAVGFLIDADDETLYNEFEGVCNAGGGVDVLLELRKIDVGDVNPQLLGELQELHDTLKLREHLDQRIDDIAVTHGLESPVPAGVI